MICIIMPTDDLVMLETETLVIMVINIIWSHSMKSLFNLVWTNGTANWQLAGVTDIVHCHIVKSLQLI